MPVHDYLCPTCGKKQEMFRKLADLETPAIGKCGHAMNRLVSAPYVVGDYAPYECPVTGKMIEGRRQHLENLKETGCRLLEPGESDNYRKSLVKADEEFEAKIEATADQLITEMPLAKREKLAAEMEQGLTTELVRASV